MDDGKRIRDILAKLKIKQSGLAKILGLSQSVISEFANGTRPPSKEFIIGLPGIGISTDWFLTGKGSMFLAQTETDSSVGNGLDKSGSIFGMGTIHQFTITPPSWEIPALPVRSSEEALQADNPVQAMTMFDIPLLTKDQAMRFNPAKEIPRQKANSGEYPDISLVSIPRRVMEYSTDLRAIEVFDSRMAPVMRSGDIAIIEATGWNGNGIHLYRMSGGLHISYVGRYDGGFHLFDELTLKKEKELPYDAQTFQPIGRVRAIVKDIFAFDWVGGTQPPLES
jgi:transcriptional regulator with XRE-family HTH domain